jgi:hypothetical protein
VWQTSDIMPVKKGRAVHETRYFVSRCEPCVFMDQEFTVRCGVMPLSTEVPHFETSNTCTCHVMPRLLGQRKFVLPSCVWDGVVHSTANKWYDLHNQYLHVSGSCCPWARNENCLIKS